MERVKKIFEKLDSLYEKIFDRIEDRGSWESIEIASNKLVGRLLVSLRKKNLEGSSIKAEEEDIFLSELDKIIEAFCDEFNPKKLKEKISENEIQSLALAKIHELFYSAIDNDFDTKKVFKHIINSLAKEYGLTSEQIKKLKVFVIEYYVQRHIVENIYNGFFSNVDNIFVFLTGKKLTEFTGIEVKKGKFGLEIFLTRDLYQKLLRSDSLGTSFSFKNLIHTILSREGGLTNFIFVDTENINSLGTVRHERQHAKYAFEAPILPNNSFGSRFNEIQRARRTGELKLTEGTLTAQFNADLRALYNSLFDEAFKNELLAQITGRRVLNSGKERLNKQSQTQIFKSLISRQLISSKEIELEEINEGIEQLEVVATSYDFRQGINSYFADSIKRTYERLGISPITIQIESLFVYEEYKKSIVNICNLIKELILNHPEDKEFIVRYLSQFSIKEWERMLLIYGKIKKGNL